VLILTRKLGESITIGDNIKVTVLGIYGRQVRLGVDAPIEVVVHREEIYVKIQQEIQQENRKASKTIKSDLMSVVNALKDRIIGAPDGRAKLSLKRTRKGKQGGRRRDNKE